MHSLGYVGSQVPYFLLKVGDLYFSAFVGPSILNLTFSFPGEAI